MPSRRLAFALLVLGGFVAFPRPRAVAEDEPPKRPPDKKGDGFKFSPPDGTDDPKTPAPKDPKAAPKPTPVPKADLDPARAAIARLAGWPGQDGIKAAETLLLMGPDAVDPCVEALTKGDAAVKPGAAWVLGKVGSAVHVPIILRAAAERQSGTRLEVFFEAADALDTPTTKRWLFNFLTLDRPVFRSRATEFLAGLVTPDDRKTIDQLVNAPVRQAGVRVAGLELLFRAKVPDATDRIVAALGDPHPDVASKASQLLAGSDDPALPARLNRIVREGDLRERCYAALSLVERTRRTRANAFEAATVPALIGRRGLMHPDRLCRGSSAVALAFGAIDSTDPSVGPLLDRDVVSVLIETAGGDHFLDYGSVVEPIFAALRRLSGLDFAATATPWAQWWQESMDGFHARRTLTKVVEADVPRARVVFDVTDAAGRRRRTAFVAQGGDPVPGAYVLPLPAFQALVDGLDDAGIWAQPDDQRAQADESLAVRVGVMNQEKRMLLAPSKEDPRYGTLLARLEALEETNVWQRYRDTDAYPDEAAWRKHTAEAFAAADPAARHALLVDMVVASFDDLKGDAERSEALDLLDRLGGLSDAQATVLLGWASQAPSFGPVESRVVESIAAMGRQTLGEPLVEALARSGTPAAAALLSKTLADSGPMRVREGFADPRPVVRSAAASAAADLLSGPMGHDETSRARLGTLLTDGLKALLADPDPVVRVRAAGSLGILGETKMLDKLDDLFREGNTATRIAVAEALGRIGGPTVQPQLVRIVGEVGPDSAPVRAAALQAMAASRNPDAVRILVFYMLNDSDAIVQQAAEAALRTARADEARGALLDDLEKGTLTSPQKARVVRVLAAFEGPSVREALGRLLEDTDPRVVDQAALGLAVQRDAVAVPYLLTILHRPEEPLRPAAVASLQDLTSLTLLVTSYDAVAEQYEAWYRLHRGGTDRAWFRDAVAKRGYDATLLAGYVRGEADRTAVPVLLRTIRDEDPVIRRNSDVALRRVTGFALPVRIDRGTTREEAKAVADRWAAWWSREAQAGPTK